MIRYHFFGKECLIDRDLNDHLNLNKNLAKQNFSLTNPAIFVNQIHSNKVVVIDDPNQIDLLHNNPPKADAIVTNLSNLTIAVFTADCVPVILFDSKHFIIAIAHCGWRGALDNIAQNTIDEMIKIGAKIDNIQAVIGPSIRQKSYQISQEFYNNFLNEKQSNNQFFVADQELSRLDNKHFLFDLPGYVKKKLTNYGIKNIADDEIDTYSNPKQFFSYRRSTHLEEKDCGRNISVVMIDLSGKKL